jgi:hypothetical protein
MISLSLFSLRLILTVEDAGKDEGRRATTLTSNPLPPMEGEEVIWDVAVQYDVQLI